MRPWTDPRQSQPLTSIVLVTYNKVELTLQCIESLYEHTEADFEVIVVDNASSDTTVADLRALGRPGLTVIANPTNDGFGRGCNLGAEAAKGEHLLFLNNDTLVCPGWLRRMLLKFYAHPQLGMVGPLTNVASNAQLVDQAGSQGPDNYLDTAARLAEAHEGEMVLERRLIGFCMAIPRAVWDQVGGFDERFGIGHYEDDDLCAKVARAGYMLAVAKDVYIYHFHGQSFDAAGVERIANMRKKAFVFYQKWGNAYLDWPDLMLNLSDLIHVIAVVDEPDWSPPTWQADQPPYLVTAISRRGRDDVEASLREHHAQSRILGFHVAERPRPLGESYNVGMASHVAKGQLLLGDPNEPLGQMLEHIEARQPRAATYHRHTAQGERLVAYYLSRTTLDAIGGLEPGGMELDELVSAHLRVARDAGVDVLCCVMTDPEAIDEAYLPASPGAPGSPLPAGLGAREVAGEPLLGSGLAWFRSIGSRLAASRAARTGWRAPKAIARPRPNEIVNITMLSYNRLDFTKRSIAALHQMTDHPHRLVVVDNGSDEDTVAWLKEAKRDGQIDIRLLNDENRGVAPAANQGWQALDAPYYVKLDNDIVLTKRGWLSALVRAANTLPDAGMVGYNFEEQSYPLATRAGLHVRPRPVHLGGACVLVSEPAHAAAGYWCEDYLPYSEEDFDMGYRLERAGFSHYYMEDEDVGLHLPHGRATQLVDGTASDDEGDPEYREFKDEARHKHIGFFSTVWINRLQYNRGLRPLYYRPGPQRHSLRLRCETALFKTLRLAWTAFRPGR